MGNVESLSYFLPEIILTITILFVLFADMFGTEQGGFDIPGGMAFFGGIIAFIAHIWLYYQPATMLFDGMIAHDMFSAFFRGFFIFSTIIVTLMTMYSTEVIHLKKGEFYSILLSICIGMCLVASSQNLVMAYLALELMSIGSYVLAGFSKKIGRSEEASLKFVLYGGVSTGVMLFGLSLLYGLTGSTDFSAIQQIISTSGQGIDLTAFTIFLLIMVGVGYKIAAVPFHFWAPDVYEGSPTTITAFLSVASKGTGFALLIRLFFSTMIERSAVGNFWTEVGDIDIDWTFNIAVLSAITMTIGNLGAISQNNLKRLLAYSGIAHAGYLLMGVCLLTDLGLQAVIFYLVTYLFTNLAAFLVVIIMVDAQDDEGIQGVRGLWARMPYTAVVMTICLFSLIGLPPTAGFVGKYYLFIALLEGKLYWLALIGVLNTVVSLYYYARVVKAMFFEPTYTEEPIRAHPVYVGLLTALAVPVVYFGIFWDPLVRYAQYCASLIVY